MLYNMTFYFNMLPIATLSNTTIRITCARFSFRFDTKYRILIPPNKICVLYIVYNIKYNNIIIIYWYKGVTVAKNLTRQISF